MWVFAFAYTEEGMPGGVLLLVGSQWGWDLFFKILFISERERESTRASTSRRWGRRRGSSRLPWSREPRGPRELQVGLDPEPWDHDLS